VAEQLVQLRRRLRLDRANLWLEQELKSGEVEKS